jgi:hypothetical protein
MKKFVYILYCALTTQCAAQWSAFNQAHPVSCQWPPFNYTAHGYFENVFVVDTLPNFYDGYLVFGNGILCYPDSCNNYKRCFSAKCNGNGDLVWWRRYDSELIDESQQWFNWYPGSLGGMIKNHANEFISIFTNFVAGDANNIDTRNYLVKMNSEAAIISQYLIDSSLAAYSFTGLLEDYTDSSYLAHGWFMDSLDVINNTEPDAFLLKLDSIGNHVWQKTYPNTFGTYTLSKSIDGGFWICAGTPPLGECSTSSFLNNDLVLIKTDEFGNEEDRIIMGGQCSNERASVYEYEEDKIILVGRLTLEVPINNDRPFEGYLFTTLVEQLSDESLIETGPMKRHIPTFGGNFVDFHSLDDGSFLIVNDAGFTEANGTGPDGKLMGCLLKLDSNRDSLWRRTYSYYNNPPEIQFAAFAKHYLLDSKPTPDGGFVCSGWIEQQQQDPNPFLKTPWLFKVDSLGCLEPGCQEVGVSEIVIGLQNTMSVYPNPASSIANIAFSFPSDYAPPKNSELVVIDMQGREVLRQSVTMFGKSNTTIELDVAKLPGGMYTVHWVSGNAWLDSISLIKQ